jgi:hypothetical protein
VDRFPRHQPPLLPDRRGQAGGQHGGKSDEEHRFGAGLLVALVAPAFATSSTTTTTTTGGSTTTTEQYYVVRDPATKKCTISESRPTGSTTVVVGGDGTVYKSRTEAQTAMTKVCTD